jgi:hypothetical protein
LKIVYNDQEIGAIEIQLRRQNSDRFSEISIEKHDDNILVQFARYQDKKDFYNPGKEWTADSKWEIKKTEKDDDNILVNHHNSGINIDWVNKENKIETGYFIPLHEIQFVKYDVKSLY